MSAVDERAALDRPTSLFDHATRLHQQNPDGPLACGGRPYPDDDAQPPRPRHRAALPERAAALLGVLEAFLPDPSASRQRLHDQLSRLDLFGSTVEAAIDKLPAHDTERLRQTGAWLVRHATDRRPALVGLGLLASTSQPDDAPLIRTIGLLRHFGPEAVRVLANRPDGTADLIWLAQRSQRRVRVRAIEALCQRGDPQAVAWLRHHAVGDGEMSASLAREVAEAVCLPEALAGEAVEADVLDLAGQLLLAMAAPNDYRTQLLGYRDARRAYAALARHLPHTSASMPRYAMVTGLVEEVRTGTAGCLEWDPGQRAEIIARLCATLEQGDWCDRLDEARRSADPLVRRRAAWARNSKAAVPDPLGLQIAVVAPDPCRPGDVQTRILVDGRPLIAAAFDKGPPFSPETLLARGSLRATDEPREVRLGEAGCTEGCCGALYVTIVREGDVVVWRDWRGYTSATPPPEMRLDAQQYDAELDRAEADHRWEWPARTVARLLQARLTSESDLLARWQCHPCWIEAPANDPGHLRFAFYHPEPPKLRDSTPWLQFVWVLPIDDTPATEQTAWIVKTVETSDPRTVAAAVGGDRELAEQLGYRWSERPW